MDHVFLDSSALAKRYVPEKGTDVVNWVMSNFAPQQLHVTDFNLLEVYATLVRKRNHGTIDDTQFRLAVTELGMEVIYHEEVGKLPFVVDDLDAPMAHTLAHNLNSVDAVLLTIALQLKATLAGQSDRLLLLTSDDRLQRAALQEALPCLNPETDDVAALQQVLNQTP